MRRTITVLQDDIDHGERGNPHRCAIARAAARDLADLVEGDFHVGVGGCVSLTQRSVEPLDGLECPVAVMRLLFMAQLPPEAGNFIGEFDLGHLVEPFKFEVELNPQ